MQSTLVRANRRSQRAIHATLALLLAAAAAAQSAAALHYTVDAKGVTLAAPRLALEVTLRVAAPVGECTVFEVPVWTPGSYRLRDFPQRITALSATVDGKPVPFEVASPTSWLVGHGKAAEVALRYRVELAADDRFMQPGPARRCLTYEGPAVYLYPRALLAAPCIVHFELPAGWSAASGLDARPDGDFAAADYDTLADCPVKLGRFQTFSYQSLGATFTAVVEGEQDLEFESGPWLDGLRAITEEGAAVFGGSYPFAHYWFLFTASRTGAGGGLEHRNCTAIGLPAARFAKEPASSFGICAHEFFHCWNVKRLRPIELGPFHYDRPNHTTGLWLSEGVTSYYGELLQTRAGLQPPDRFWRSMGSLINRLESTPGRAHVSSEQASWRVWNRQAGDRSVDYYTSGAVLGLLLDLQIRHASNNRQSFDDAMAAMWRHCEEHGAGLTPAQVESICSRTAGIDLGRFFAAHVRGTVAPDYETLLGHAGIAVTAKRTSERALRGLGTQKEAAPTFTDWQALEASGGGDPTACTGRLRSIDGKPVATAKEAKDQVAASTDKTSLLVEYERADGTLRQVNAAIEERVQVRRTLELRPEPDAAALALRTSLTQARRVAR